jgi:hypothetical protein
MKDDAKLSLIQNERTKLLANALDRASTACLAIGIFGPIAGLSATPTRPSAIVMGLGLAIWLAMAVIFHAAARFALGRLK